MAGYINIDELERLGLNKRALLAFTDEEKQAAIDTATAEIDSWIARAVDVPLTAPIGLAVKLHTARMAVYNLLSVRGMDPDADRLIFDNYKMARDFFLSVGKGLVQLGDNVLPPEQNPAGGDDEPYMESDPSRGFSRYWV